MTNEVMSETEESPKNESQASQETNAQTSGEKGTVEKVKIGGSSVVVAKGEVFF